MTAARDLRPVRSARSRCHALELDPGRDRDQRWSCRIVYATRAGERGHADYLMAIEPRGCFVAASGDWPADVFERVLRRRSRNPLVRLRSCP